MQRPTFLPSKEVTHLGQLLASQIFLYGILDFFGTRFKLHLTVHYLRIRAPRRTGSNLPIVLGH